MPAGDGGIVLGLRLGDSVFGRVGDHAAPGACLVHPEPAARHALAIYSCIGNEAVVRTGAAAGARGAVIGKRGEHGRVIVGFGAGRPGQDAAGRPGGVRAAARAGGRPACRPSVTVLNIDPGLLAAAGHAPGERTGPRR